MKVSVVRQLSNGIYQVAFKVGDFSVEEIQKMGSFGVPAIALFFGPPNARQVRKVNLNQISEQFNPGFSSEEEARDYERGVLEQIRGAMKSLRERKDDFTSSSEESI